MSIGYASVSAEGALPSSNYDIKQSNSYTKKIVAFIYMYVVYESRNELDAVWLNPGSQRNNSRLVWNVNSVYVEKIGPDDIVERS